MGLITKEVEITLNGNNMKWFESKGYTIPKRKDKWGELTTPQGTKIMVKVEDLKKSSCIKVDVQCDNCGKISSVIWVDYKRYMHKDGKNYCNSCSLKLFGIERMMKTQLSNSKSFKQWCLENNRKDILDRWDYELNNCNPNEICYSSRIKRYFKCPERKHKSELKCIYGFTGNRNDIFCIECNMIYNAYPHLIKYFVNEEDTRNSAGSDKKVLMKCSDCGYEKELHIQYLIKRGFSCPRCSDGISYPEKFMFNLLEQLNIDFIYQLSKTNFDWCDKYKYDFYIPQFNMIIETHGMQHYDNKRKWNNNIQENDKIKKELALKNNIGYYIILDCRYSKLEWIKNTILQSELSLLFEFKNQDKDIDWLKCHEHGCKSTVKKACDLWNDKIISVKEIADKLKINRTTVIRYLKQGTELGLCYYNSKEEKERHLILRIEKQYRKVICLNINMLFKSIIEASNYFNISASSITACCKNKLKYTGRSHITNEPLHWMYYEDYLVMQENNQIETK